MAQVNALIAVPLAVLATSTTLYVRLAILVISCSTLIAWPYPHALLLTMSTPPTISAWLATILALAVSITLPIAPHAAEAHCTSILV